MVEGQSMTTVADVVAQARDGRLEDFVREAVVTAAAISARSSPGRSGQSSCAPYGCYETFPVWPY
jgi:hypothetical protein